MATIAADSASAADVQTAINAASDGDTVTVPAGEADYDDTHKVTCTKGITLQGAGIDSTIIVDKTGGAFENEPFVFTTKTGYTTRITGFTFDGQNSGASSMGIIKIKGTYGAGNFRVDHNKFRNLAIRGLTAWVVFGVIDNNTFLAPYDVTVQAIAVFGDGATAWTRGLTLGTVNATYVEDNTFTYDYDNDCVLDAYSGARFVFRYNTITNANISWHGCDSGNYRSPHTFEVYANNFTTSVSVGDKGLLARGGTGVIYDNTYVNVGGSWYNNLYLTNYRSCASYGVWGICDGLNPIDGNDDASGYHCQDQCGWTSTGEDDGTGPNQILAPIYAWDNTEDGVAFELSAITTCEEIADHIQEDRDFYNSEHPTYTPYTYPHPLRGEIPYRNRMRIF